MYGYIERDSIKQTVKASRRQWLLRTIVRCQVTHDRVRNIMSCATKIYRAMKLGLIPFVFGNSVGIGTQLFIGTG